MIGACAALVSALAALVTALRNGRKIDAVHKEVHTVNGQSAQTIGELISESEARRINGESSARLHSGDGTPEVSDGR